jgi:hypothetical protein
VVPKGGCRGLDHAGRLAPPGPRLRYAAARRRPAALGCAALQEGARGRVRQDHAPGTAEMQRVARARPIAPLLTRGRWAGTDAAGNRSVGSPDDLPRERDPDRTPQQRGSAGPGCDLRPGGHIQGRPESRSRRGLTGTPGATLVAHAHPANE